MSNDTAREDVKLGICHECGHLKPMQKLHCTKHDVVYDPGKHCDHCEDEFIRDLMANTSSAVKEDSNDAT